MASAVLVTSLVVLAASLAVAWGDIDRIALLERPHVV